MYNFLLNIITFASLGAVIFILARALPRVSDVQPAESREPNRFEKLMAKLPVEKADAIFNSFLEKFLRKSKVVISKVDYFLQSHLHRLRKNGKASAQPLPLDQTPKSEEPKV